jgi:hypothetical protein
MRFAGHVERVEPVKNAYRILVENLKGRNDSEDRDVETI